MKRCTDRYKGRMCRLPADHKRNWPHVSALRGGTRWLWIEDPDAPGNFVRWSGSANPESVKRELGQRMASTFQIPEGP